MSGYEELLNNEMPKWPYPVNYDKENEASTDILVLGGGLAGCHAVISAVKRGAKVIVVDKASIQRSGSGGAGIDHWGDAFTNPSSQISPEEAMELGVGQALGKGGYYSLGHTAYISFKESYDTLIDVERMGVPVRDSNDEFAGARFRDGKTKLLFAYDYESRDTIRLRGGHNLKLFLYRELRRLGVQLYEHIMATSLLTQEGKQGAQVKGATGINVRTGEFYIFKAKATILAMSIPSRLWVFNTELAGSNAEHFDPNNTGDGHAMAWKAGAEFTLMERSGRSAGPFVYPAYGTGYHQNTWYACTIVDNNGKEIPWVDRDGRVLKTVSERNHPAPEQKLFLVGPTLTYEIQQPDLIPDLPERIMKGEYKLPLYADLPSMPEHERRAIFGLMVGNEGKTRIPIYETYTRAGFDPDKDMLQAAIVPPQFVRTCWAGHGPPQWRSFGGGGPVVDWDLKTNLGGLYAVVSGGCAGASTNGRYTGRKAADYAQAVSESIINRKQVDEEKEFVYTPVKRKDGIGWKELQAGVCRIMQDYCGEYKSEEILRMGLWWLDSIEESEATKVHARNPHELWRTLEVLSRITVGKMIMHASLARRASSQALDFKRLDYPKVDPPEWNKFVTIRLGNGEVKIGELPLNYWLLPPNAPTYEENYKQNCGL